MIFYQGDVLEVLAGLPSESVDHIITSPPYYNLLDYGDERQHGLEASVQDYLFKMVDVAQELHRVCKEGSVMFMVVGDTMSNYSPILPVERGHGIGRERWITRRKPEPGYRQKTPLMVPFKLGEYIRTQTPWNLRMWWVWDKGMNSSTPPNASTDGPTITSEIILQFIKSKKSRPSGNASGFTHGNVIALSNRHSQGWGYPEVLVQHLLNYLEPIDESRVIMDPYIGTGTTAKVVEPLDWDCIGIDLFLPEDL